MKKTFTILIAAIAAILMMAQPVKVWADSDTYEIVFKTVETDSNTDLGANPTVSDVVSEGTGYVSAFSNCVKIYNGVSGVKLGSSKAAGTINFTLATNYQTNIKTIKVVSVQYGSDTGTLTLYNGNTSLHSGITPGVDYTYTFDNPTTVTSIKLTTSAKRAYITKIVITTETNSTPTCVAPTFSPAAGTYEEEQSVTISTTTEGAAIYYTMGEDPSDPTTSSTLYESAITVDESTTIKAIAVKEGYNNSSVSTAAYVIETPAPSQTFSKITGHNPVANQTYLIVDLNTNRALTSANGTSSSPTAVAVTVENNQIITNNTDIQWTFESVEGGYVIHPAGDNEKWLYTTNSNNTGVRVGTNQYKIWTLDQTGSNTQNYHGFKHNQYNRYLGVYNGEDWRSYTSIGDNIKDTQIALFVLGDAPSDPVITASNVNIAYSAINNGEITFSVTNTVEGATMNAEVLSGATITNMILGSTTNVTSPLSFSCGANSESNTTHTATVRLSYVKNNETLTYKDVTITQAAAPVIYTTIADIYAAATYTETNVKVTFGGWVVTGIKGNQAFISDGTNGLIIYESEHGFVAGNTLTGTVDCSLVLYYGAAELKGITASTTGLTVGTGGSVTPQVVTAGQMTNGIKTGAVVTFENLAYDGSSFSDGTNTIAVQTSLYNYSGDVESGNSYNITGVYEHTLRIYPRSAADITDYTPITTPALYNYSINGVDNDPIDANVGDVITLASGIDLDAFTFAGWTTDPNDVDTRLTGSYTLTEDVTTFYAVYARVGGTSTSEVILDGDDETGLSSTIQTTSISENGYDYNVKDAKFQPLMTGANPSENYLINKKTIYISQGGYVYNTTSFVGGITKFELYENRGASASAKVGVMFSSTSQISEYNAESATEYLLETVDNVYELAVPAGAKYFWIQATNKNPQIQLRITYSTTSAQYFTRVFQNETINKALAIVGPSIIPSGKYLNMGSNTLTNELSASKLIIEDNAQLITTSAVAATVEKHIDAYNDNNDGWNLITSPVTNDLVSAEVTGLIPTTGTYDLYFLDEEESMWRNYKVHDGNTSSGFGIQHEKGYLYSNSADTDIRFAGTVQANTNTSTYNVEITKAGNGWNLIGNPFPFNAYANRTYYTFVGRTFTAVENYSESPVAPCTGIIVKANGTSNEAVTFSKTAPEGANNSGNIQMSVLKDNVRGNSVLDNAIVSFNEGNKLEKFQLFEGDTKIYFPMEDADYAIVSSDGHGTMPVNFKAKEMGMYTISVETEGIDMSYLHLIDRLTGEDVNLLLDNEYSFIASNNDSEERFILSFTEKGYDAHGNEIFVYQSGNDLIVNGEGELQIFDVMGRMVKNTTINGVETIAMPQGVYIFKLNENIQKIVVR